MMCSNSRTELSEIRHHRRYRQNEQPQRRRYLNPIASGTCWNHAAVDQSIHRSIDWRIKRAKISVYMAN